LPKLYRQIRDYVRAGEGHNIAAARQHEIERITVRLFSGAHGVSRLRSQYGDSLTILMTIVAVVLLIACANLANFLLARAIARQRETATRLALGSSHGSIIRQSMLEALLLSLSGGLLGLGLAFTATRALIAFVAQGATYVPLDPSPDFAILLFTLGVSVFAGLLFGLATALHVARASAMPAMNATARTAAGSGGRTSRWWAKALVTSQIMFCLLLLVAAGLFLRTLRNLQHQDFGFERTRLLIADFSPGLAGYKPAQIPALNPGPKEDMGAVLNRVSGQYFETAGISMVAGRPMRACVRTRVCFRERLYGLRKSPVLYQGTT
jgi:FtsX-like permease family